MPPHRPVPNRRPTHCTALPPRAPPPLPRLPPHSIATHSRTPHANRPAAQQQSRTLEPETCRICPVPLAPLLACVAPWRQHIIQGNRAAAHRTSVLTFAVLISYMRRTASVICRLFARVSTMKTRVLLSA